MAPSPPTQMSSSHAGWEGVKVHQSTEADQGFNAPVFNAATPSH